MKYDFQKTFVHFMQILMFLCVFYVFLSVFRGFLQTTLESFSHDRERIGELILSNKHQTHYLLFVFIYYYKLNGLFSFTIT